jgi:hypothetical protein
MVYTHIRGPSLEEDIMNTTKAKGTPRKARKPAPKEVATLKQRLDTFGKAVGRGAEDFVHWLRKAMEAVMAGVATFGRSAADTATAIEAELRDDVAGVKKRLAAKKEAAPARKPAKKPASAKKVTGRRKAPTRRKATARKAPARRTATRKKTAPRRKAVGAGK